MMASIAPPDRQHSLFDALPATEPRRRRPRARPPAAAEGAPPTPTPVPSFAESPPVPFWPAPPMAAQPVAVRIDAAALSRPDLCDLVRDLAEPSLGFLLVEAAREVKRRLVPEDPEESEADSPPEPSPQLLRAIRSVVTELAEGE